MEQKYLFEGERRLLNIIWDHEPLASGELVRLCLQVLGWKKSTTYTMLKRLSEKGFLINENSMVRSLVSRQEAQSAESEYVVAQAFSGSLPGFLVSFLGDRKISDQEAEELKRLIDAHRENI